MSDVPYLFPSHVFTVTRMFPPMQTRFIALFIYADHALISCILARNRFRNRQEEEATIILHNAEPNQFFFISKGFPSFLSTFLSLVSLGFFNISFLFFDVFHVSNYIIYFTFSFPFVSLSLSSFFPFSFRLSFSSSKFYKPNLNCSPVISISSHRTTWLSALKYFWSTKTEFVEIDFPAGSKLFFTNIFIKFLTYVF